MQIDGDFVAIQRKLKNIFLYQKIKPTFFVQTPKNYKRLQKGYNLLLLVTDFGDLEGGLRAGFRGFWVRQGLGFCAGFGALERDFREDFCGWG